MYTKAFRLFDTSSTIDFIYTAPINSTFQRTNIFASFPIKSFVTFTFEFCITIQIETIFCIDIYVLNTDFNKFPNEILNASFSNQHRSKIGHFKIFEYTCIKCGAFQ